MKRVITICVSICALLSLTTSLSAAKLRVRNAATTGASLTYSTAKLSRQTNSVIVTFQNLGSVKRIAYELSYLSNGALQGAMGTVQTAGLVSDTRDLYFGTCSHGVCTPHYNITNATLMITTTVNTGGVNTKRYRIKI